jgi:protein-disulfide isomerase
MKVLIGLSLLICIVSCSESIGKAKFIYKNAPSNGQVAKIGNQVLSENELRDGIEDEIYEAEKKLFDVKLNKIKSLMMKKFMESDPRSKGLSNDEYLEKFIAKNVKVTNDDIEKLIKERNFPREEVNDMVKEKIREYITNEKKKLSVDQWMSEQMAKTSVEIYVSKPQRPVFDVNAGNGPSMGGKDAKITIVEFSDFQCPYCSQAAKTMKILKDKYKDKVKIVFRNYPLPFHNQAEGAAVAGLCAQEQSPESFWKMHDYMFDNQQGGLDPASLKQAARKIGLKGDQFDQCLDTNKYLAQVRADMEEGKRVKVKSTPTFFVNGQLLGGAFPPEVFEEVIDDLLTQK